MHFVRGLARPIALIGATLVCSGCVAEVPAAGPPGGPPGVCCSAYYEYPYDYYDYDANAVGVAEFGRPVHTWHHGTYAHGYSHAGHVAAARGGAGHDNGDHR